MPGNGGAFHCFSYGFVCIESLLSFHVTSIPGMRFACAPDNPYTQFVSKLARVYYVCVSVRRPAIVFGGMRQAMGLLAGTVCTPEGVALVVCAQLLGARMSSTSQFI